MSSKTTNFNLHKIDLTDAPPDITVLNQNWDKIDQKLMVGHQFIVNLVDDGSGYVCDKTYSEVLSAYNDGRVINALHNKCYYPLAYADANTFVFSSFEGTVFNVITLTSSNETLFYYTVTAEKNHTHEVSEVTGAVQIQTVSYTGNGGYGSSNPTSVTFNFAPKILFMRDSNGGITYSPVIMDFLTTSYKEKMGFVYSYSHVKKSSDGKTITWYTDSSVNPAQDQCNDGGRVYRVVAIG